MESIKQHAVVLDESMKTAEKEFSQTYGVNGKAGKDATRELTENAKELGRIERENEINSRNAKESTEALEKAFQNAGGRIATFSSSLVQAVQGLNQLAMGASIVSEAIDTLNNKDLSFTEKMATVLPQLAMGLPALINGFKTLKGVVIGPILSGIKQFGTLLVGAITGGVAGFHALVVAA